MREPPFVRALAQRQIIRFDVRAGIVGELRRLSRQNRAGSPSQTPPITEGAGVSQSELSRRSGVSFAIIHPMAQNSTEQVWRKTLDRLSWSLGEILGRALEPGELVARGAEPKRGRRG